jgi:(p)ppGpp synthase/HD superfamily hydrolase
MDKKIEWVIQQHRNTNHFYDEYLPYEFHLRMVVQAFQDWKHLLSEKLQYECHFGAWGHDLIEDTRTSYNDVAKVLGAEVAEIVRAVTNYGRGRNRAERMPDFVYEDIRNTPGAVFVKLCDRIANVQYSKMSRSSMFNKYKEENPEFILKLGYSTDHPYVSMFHYLQNLIDTKS